MSLLEVNDLRVELAGEGCDVVDEIHIAVDEGKVLGIVGESGSGKTTVAHALLGNARRGTRITQGSVTIDGVNLLAQSPRALSRLRGKLVSYVPQDPSAALSPALRIGRHLMEPIEFHGAAEDRDDAARRVREALAEVALPSDDAFLRRYPHQLSGGQQQRVLLAMAFILRPRLVVLDEPTTGLDVTTQAQVLRVARELFEQHGVAVVYVTHDLSVVAQIATDVVVMYGGRIVERGSTKDLFSVPAHPYTRRLMAASLDVAARRILTSIPGRAALPGKRPDGCPFHPRCELAEARCRVGTIPRVDIHPGHEVQCVRAFEPGATRPPMLEHRPATERDAEIVLSASSLTAWHGDRKVLDDVSIALERGECLAVVGESGSGKTTLARCLIGLHRSRTGTITFREQILDARRARDRPEQARRLVQYIFQSPYGSLNPRQLCGDTVSFPLRTLDRVGRKEARRCAEETIERVGLSAGIAAKYPDQLSGGERQRVAIARALVCRPEVLICDEVTSALDVSAQATILQLLQQLHEEEGLSTIFITHNLAIVRNVADRVIVMHGGRVIEAGVVASVLDAPAEPYTERLVADTPPMPTAVG